ncbi:dTDP-4-dehydrorhamnose reductase [Niastella yeongjuensis]|uniref:dTDP-4-dehydrorhamnose reductase n=1 Tax=Niastella yeongjuensis TaxID=354355 RepID=A0A1V9EZ90_9BACT|nr:dTDP-4-dehydrorhamnose reductase [Niastella yeongjuensis]OQP51356.1 dTDP-4-dehydrorhamnose reductase [Niastella yeongjuensis]SEP38409.1 dTDP-4-dehydrorhamnose reductase [Niastella yeongjuensis]
MSQPVIIVTGANGQVGQELQVLSASYPEFTFVFTDTDNMPINDEAAVEKMFATHHPAYCLNCAAYTAVDKAETEQELAFSVNAEGARILAAACKNYNTRFIHISTDYVFDGQSPTPYKEDAPTDPVNQYGASKLKGEQLSQQVNPDTIIIRTAWVYSYFGKNFVKTMIKLMQDRPAISVVNDQVGAPTYAADLAACMLQIVAQTQASTANWHPGLYHYSNQGRISWFDFAVAIKELTGSACTVTPIPSEQFPTPAKRPSFSLLDTSKIRKTFHCTIPDWKDSLRKCVGLLV